MSYAYTAYWWLSHELQPRRSPVTMFPESRPTDSLPAKPPMRSAGRRTARARARQPVVTVGQQNAEGYFFILKQALARGLTVRLRSLAR